MAFQLAGMNALWIWGTALGRASTKPSHTPAVGTARASWGAPLASAAMILWTWGMALGQHRASTKSSDIPAVGTAAGVTANT